MKAVIQSGGRGTRLRPYTSVLPKPLMPIGARPVIELLLKWLRRNGIEDIYITTGYLGHLIRSFCGDGNQWGMNITYTQETEPLGTIGPLSLLRDKLDCTFLVLNGDVLTDLSLNAFSTCHRNHGGPLTIATTTRTMKMEFGVIDETNGSVTRFREKPTLSNTVSMGAYCMEPEVLQYIPAGHAVRLRRPRVLHDGSGRSRSHLQAQRPVAGYRSRRGFPQSSGNRLGRADSVS